ncbi:MAG: PD40 domain-containing protein [Cohnella sp.]|nr:PD40 domain-containing protein [Cohnella sp.]
MSKGTRYPSEAKAFRDETTGLAIRQITNHPSIHHQPFFMIPAYDDAMRRLIFVSHRTGTPQIFSEERATGQLVQLTERDDLAEWSVHPSHDGNYVYFTAAATAWRLDLHTLKEELLADFGSARLKEGGMVAAGMGTTALSRDDRWWAVRYTEDGMACLAIIDVNKHTWKTILRRDHISHMQFCPDDPDLLFYAGPLTDRVWVVRRDGTGNRRLYKRNAERKEWITHETWIPGTKELAFVDWPNGIRCVNAATGAERQVAAFNAWHAVCNRSGTLMVADTNFPDRGLLLFDPHRPEAGTVTLCYPQATSMGAHWAGPFPYDDGPVEVYAPQHTHPHPSFSPDGTRIVYTSDRSGFAQLYEVMVPAFGS